MPGNEALTHPGLITFNKGNNWHNFPGFPLHCVSQVIEKYPFTIQTVFHFTVYCLKHHIIDTVDILFLTSRSVSRNI